MARHRITAYEEATGVKLGFMSYPGQFDTLHEFLDAMDNSGLLPQHIRVTKLEELSDEFTEEIEANA